MVAQRKMPAETNNSGQQKANIDGKQQLRVDRKKGTDVRRKQTTGAGKELLAKQTSKL
jgi:hypothetical protein